MPKPKSPVIEYRCCVCGRPLDEENSRPNSSMCLACESKQFAKLEEDNGCHVAIFLMCGMTNTPCLPLIVPKGLAGSKEDKWYAYLGALDENDKLYKSDGTPMVFADGVTNLRKIFGKDVTENDFAKYIAYELQRREKQIGTDAQHDRWGTGELCKGLALTTELYNELDRQLEIWKERYKGQTITPQLESSLITICKRNMVADYLVKTGDYVSASKVQKMCDDLMASEQLRKKDEKPIEALKLDAMVVALENAGLMENGDLLSYDELIEVMRDKFVKSKKYYYSLDVADQLLADIENTMRENDDKPRLIEFPESSKTVDEYGEFEPEETKQEIENKRFAGLTKVQFEKPLKKRGQA